jgi:hypothetical protein
MSEIPIPDAGEQKSSHADGYLHRIQPWVTLVIAVAAIGLAIWEGAENRRHNRLSVQPRLAGAVDAGRESAAEYVRMTVENTGLGPAVVKTFRIYWDGVPRDTIKPSSSTQWQTVIEAVADARTQVTARGLSRGYYFPPGRQHTVFDARRTSPSPEGEGALARVLDRLAVQICYCSIYNTDCDEVLLATARTTTLSCTR